MPFSEVFNGGIDILKALRGHGQGAAIN